MARGLKLKISMVLPSFHSCRSNDTSTRPSYPVPSTPKSNLTNPHYQHAIPLPSSQFTTSYSTIRRQVSSAFTSVGCSFRSRSTPIHDNQKQTPEFRWEKDEKWLVVAKVCEDGACPHRKHVDACPLCLLSAEKKKKKKKKKRITKRKAIPRLRISTSSAESGLFSSEGFGDINDEETEALVSSSSSSESNPKKTEYFPECESPARLSVFQRLIPCRVEGKVRESFAVVKRSEDPYEDFKRSMTEMILEKEMWEETDLEQLLHCFLSLNDTQHHGIILEAFTEIWKTLFCRKLSRQ